LSAAILAFKAAAPAFGLSSKSSRSSKVSRPHASEAPPFFYYDPKNPVFPLDDVFPPYPPVAGLFLFALLTPPYKSLYYSFN